VGTLNTAQSNTNCTGLCLSWLLEMQCWLVIISACNIHSRNCQKILALGDLQVVILFLECSVVSVMSLCRWHMLKKLFRNWYQKLARKIWRKFITVFLYQNNSPANHVARFVSRAGQLLCWNRAVLNCVQETCTRKTCTRLADWLTHVQVTCTRRLVPVCGTSFLSVCRRALQLLTLDIGVGMWHVTGDW